MLIGCVYFRTTAKSLQVNGLGDFDVLRTGVKCGVIKISPGGEVSVSRGGDGRCGGGHRDVPGNPGAAGDGAAGGGARAVATWAVPGEAEAAAGSARDVCAIGARVRGGERDRGASARQAGGWSNAPPGPRNLR